MLHIKLAIQYINSKKILMYCTKQLFFIISSNEIEHSRLRNRILLHDGNKYENAHNSQIICNVYDWQAKGWVTLRKYLAACVRAATSVVGLARDCSQRATATQHRPAWAQASPSLRSLASCPEVYIFIAWGRGVPVTQHLLLWCSHLHVSHERRVRGVWVGDHALCYNSPMYYIKSLSGASLLINEEWSVCSRCTYVMFKFVRVILAVMTVHGTCDVRSMNWK